jgi:endonuclease/exonuclease/phosphatase family metal-dependent hydrolase
MMRKMIICLGMGMLAAMSMWGQVPESGSGLPELELITYNIRMNTPSDGKHAWPQRREHVFSLIRFHRAQVFGVQEALPEQMDELAAAFPDFAYEGVGRDDGDRAGEFSAVFYSNERFRKLDGGTFWLSESPEECSYGWDAACRRVCSWVKLEEPSSHRILYVFNTHFDHKGMEARRNSARLILSKISEITGGEGPVVLCGDFNLAPDTEPIAEIREQLGDAFEVTELPPYGSVGTYHGFTYDDPVEERIDYVFVSKEVRVLRYGALTDSRDRTFFSDHLPVLVTLQY